MLRLPITARRERRAGLRLRLGAATALLVIAIAATANAQQFLVDDAGIVDDGACQLEAWLGETRGFVLPACAPIVRTELTLGFGFVDEPHGDHVHRHTELVAQAKINLIPDDPGVLGLGVVAGVGVGPIGQAVGAAFEGLYAYVPATYTLATARARFHGNLGWAFDIGEERHRAIYGLRADVVLHERVTVIGEYFGDGPDMGVHGGLRVTLIPDLFLIDASYGATVAGELPDIGFTIGFALTPPAFFRPIGS